MLILPIVGKSVALTETIGYIKGYNINDFSDN